MKINGKDVKTNSFAYDECHKIYLIEDLEDREKALEADYNIYPINEIENVYNFSCELKFISNWKLNKTYVAQFENAKFE